MPVKKKQKSNSFIFLLIGGFILILIVSLATMLPKTPVKGDGSDTVQNTADQAAKGNESQLIAVITGRDDMMPGFTLRNIEDGQDLSLTLTGGSAVMDKYGKNVVADSLKIGDLAEVTYDADTSIIISLKLWDQAWRYEGIKNWSVNTEEGTFTIADRLYKYPDYLLITREGKSLTLNDLDKTDELMAIGYEKNVYSILVTKGHGTLRFEDYGDFLGGTVYIGKKEILPIEENMVVTVREGDYDITMEKGSFSGTKTVTVLPDKETEVNMGEFKKPPVKTCKVNFHITPLGAELYIDNLLVFYDNPVDIEYGEHDIKVSLGGYKTYTGTLETEEEEKDIFIKLVESDNKSEESSASENGSDTNSGSGNTDSTDTNTNGTNTNGANNSSTDTGSSNTSSNGTTSDNGSTNYVYIQSPDGASVYVNGEFKGIAPVSFPKTTAGQLYITFIQSGYETKTYTVEVKNDGEDTKLNFPALEASK
ncbi:PEGA domain-containing protein [Anaerocolumna xylanovorans DSM 12503]|uniref:PEGA domain-containing protein n=2 Tax=Anaerocolumna TaxID=1843210 RepID=A0A1M7YKA7_9FIRM|nr:PEGA domain-containing protein [Anaerocolumna xylanovorans DSM 12503]